MKKINFVNKPNTDTPINDTNLNKMQDNIEAELNNIIQSINKSKTITFNGEWIYAVNPNGGNTRIRIPIFNPTGTSPTLTNFSGHFFDGGGWKDITDINVSTSKTTFTEISFTTDETTIHKAVLVRLYGTVQAK